MWADSQENLFGGADNFLHSLELVTHEVPRVSGLRNFRGIFQPRAWTLVLSSVIYLKHALRSCIAESLDLESQLQTGPWESF